MDECLWLSPTRWLLASEPAENRVVSTGGGIGGRIDDDVVQRPRWHHSSLYFVPFFYILKIGPVYGRCLVQIVQEYMKRVQSTRARRRRTFRTRRARTGQLS